MTDIEKKLCELADLLMSKYNPCGWNGDACIVGNPSPCCILTRFGKNGCPFSKDRKCTNPNIECKSWFCMTAVKNMSSECYTAFKHIEGLAQIYGLVKPPLLGHSNYVGADKLPNR